jgi:hypothetical protein
VGRNQLRGDQNHIKMDILPEAVVDVGALATVSLGEPSPGADFEGYKQRLSGMGEKQEAVQLSLGI